MPLTFGSLFAGIGGFDLGFEQAGMVCKWQVEIDDYATKVLEKHWPDVRRHSDVRTWPQPDTEPVDVICGGFPCQDISNAGKRAGLDGDRSGLFFEIIRIACEIRPRFIVLENVSALLNRGLDRVLGELAQIGFDAEWHCIPASAVGAPHQRDRVFIIASISDAFIQRTWNESGAISGQGRQHPKAFQSETLRFRDGQALPKGVDAICPNVSNANGIRLETERAKQQASRLARNSEELADTNESRLQRRQKTRNINEIRQRPEQQPERCTDNIGAIWAIEPNVGRVAYGVPKRVDRLRCLGNSIVPQVAEIVGRRVIEINRSFSPPSGEPVQAWLGGFSG